MCIYIYTYLKTAEPNININFAFFLSPPFLRGTARAFHLNRFTQSALASYSWPRTTLQCSDCSECVPSWSLPPSVSACSAETEKVRKLSSEENLQPFKDKMDEFLSQGESFCFNQAEENERGVWAKTVPPSSWVLIVLPLWKYELILNEIDQHVRISSDLCSWVR